MAFGPPPSNSRNSFISPGGGAGSFGPPPGGSRSSSKKKKKKGFWDSIEDVVVPGRAFSNLFRETRPVTGGVGGFFENLGRDVESTAVGLFPGLYTIGRGAGEAAVYGSTGGRLGSTRRIEDVAKSIARQYAQTYGPLFRGDVGEFFGNVYEQPLGPILDAATVATLGTTGAVKGAGLASRAGLVKNVPEALKPAARVAHLRSPRLLEGGYGEYVTKPIVGSELSRRLKLAAHNALNRLPPDMPGFGELSRFNRALRSQYDKGQAALLNKLIPFHQIRKDLSAAEGRASVLRSMYPLPDALDNFKLKHAKGDLMKILDDPKVMELYSNPSPKMLELEKVVDDLDANFVFELSKIGNVSGMSPILADYIRWEPMLVAMGAKYNKAGLLEFPAGFDMNRMVNFLRDQLKAKGLPEPRYFPHVSELKQIRVPRAGTMTPPRSPVRVRSGVLESVGRLILEPDVWLQKFLENSKFIHYHDIWDDTVRKYGVHLDDPEEISAKLKQGWKFVTRKNEKIGQLERSSGSWSEYIDNLLNEDPQNIILHGNEKDLITGSLDEAAVIDGKRVMVPPSYAKQVIGEYKNASGFVTKWYKNLTTVWRALVLNLRVGWLANNIIGNALLYGIANAGVKGIRALGQAIGEMLGPHVLKRMFTDKAISKRLTADDIAELIPEQYVGTFFGTQLPEGGLAGKISQSAITALPRAVRKIDVAWEQALRRAMVNKLVRESPEFRRTWNQLPEETRTFRDAAKISLRNNPRMVQRVSQEVNDALGNFFSLSHFERSVLRSTAPFYAWYKAMTVVALKLPLDHPMRTQVLAAIGRIGAENQADSYGLPYLMGGIDIGGGARIQTRAANPFATPVDVTRGLRAGFPGANPYDARTLVGMINPIAEAIGTSATLAQEGQARDPYGLFFSPAFQIGRDLPQTRLFFPYESKLYSDESDLRRILAYLGISIKTPRPSEARKRAKEGR